jgi:hypothetical protein
LQYYTVCWNDNNQLWPEAAYQGIVEVNSNLGLKYTKKQLKTMMWNYNGGRPQ